MSFQDLVYIEDLDITAVTETWLKDTVSNAVIVPCDYNIARKYRPADKRGGGVLFAVRNDIHFNQITTEARWESLELVAIKLVSPNSKKCLLSVCYRPPNSNTNEWLRLFTSFLETSSGFRTSVNSRRLQLPESDLKL